MKTDSRRWENVIETSANEINLEKKSIPIQQWICTFFLENCCVHGIIIIKKWRKRKNARAFPFFIFSYHRRQRDEQFNEYSILGKNSISKLVCIFIRDAANIWVAAHWQSVCGIRRRVAKKQKHAHLKRNNINICINC